MNKFTQNSGQKWLAVLSIVTIGAAIMFHQNIALAMVYKGDELDVMNDFIEPACDPNDNQSASDVAINDNRLYAFVWEDDVCDGVGNGAGIYMERYDIFSGSTSGVGMGPVQISTTITGDQKNPSITMDNNGNYVVAWEGEGPGDTYGIFVRAFDFDGTPRGPEHLVNTYTTGVQSAPKVAIDFDGQPNQGQEQHFAVVWQGEGTEDTDGIYMQRFNITFGGDIATVGSNISVNTYTAGSQVDPDIGMTNADDTLITWSGPGTGYTTTDQVWMQGYSTFGTPWNGTANNIRVNTAEPAVKPALALNKSNEASTSSAPSGNGVIVYTAGVDNQVYGKLVEHCANAPNPCPLSNVELNINGTTSSLPDVAMDYLGNFTVTWEQDDGADMNIHGINYDYLGHRIDTQFQINDNVFGDTTANQTNSALAKDKDGEYFVTWTSPHTTQGNDVRYKAYGTDIFKYGSETIAHPGTALFGEAPTATAIAPNGNHVVVFIGQDTLSGQSRIYYSLYDTDNNAIIENQVADTVDDSSVSFPSVSFFKDTQGTDVGRFVIVWTGTDPVLTGNTVVYREFDIDGNAILPAETALITPAPDITYGATRVSAGYYNDSTATVIDRFAVITFAIDISGATDVIGVYHTEVGQTASNLETGIITVSPFGNGVDLYPDLAGNDKIVYTWDADDGGQNGVYAQEANGALPLGTKFLVNNTTANQELYPDVAFVSPVQYVITWSQCPNGDCVSIIIYASRYTGDFAGGAPAVTDDDFVVYPGGGNEVLSNAFSRISADTTNGSFLIVWEKTFDDFGIREMAGKYFETVAGLANFGVGFTISSTPNGNGNNPDVDMNNNGRAVVSWDGPYHPFGISIDEEGAMLQVLNNPTFVSTLPELPTSTQLNITEGGKTLTIPSTIQFPNITATTTAPTDVEREIDENPSPGQPLFFQLEDLGGNSAGCTPGPCYNVTISSTDFTYTDPSTSTTYTIPSSNIFIQNYDGNHPGVGTGACGTEGADLEGIFGIGTDFSLDASTCDYASLDMNRTLINKLTNTSETARIRWYPKLKITVPALMPPGTYTGTFTITSV